MADRVNPEPSCEIIPNCPVCNGQLTVSHDFSHMKICVCRTCGTSLTIPGDAWDRARLAKHQSAILQRVR